MVCGAGAALGIGGGAAATGCATNLGAATLLRSLGLNLDGGGGAAKSATCTGLGTKSGGFLLNRATVWYCMLETNSGRMRLRRSFPQHKRCLLGTSQALHRQDALPTK